jgi:hypothetical protein
MSLFDFPVQISRIISDSRFEISYNLQKSEKLILLGSWGKICVFSFSFKIIGIEILTANKSNTEIQIEIVPK